MKRIAAMAAVFGVCSISSAWSLTSSLAIHRMAASNAENAAAAAPGLCIYNFSKNGCDGVVEPGHYEHIGCEGADCRTIRVTDAVYQTTMKTSGLSCGLSCESRCDEVADGRLTLKFDYVLRADSCCPYRGSWNGEWEFVTFDGRVFKGEAHGTIGVGTNRESDCDIVGDKCERCYDVILQDNQWLVGIEGSFRGVGQNSTSPIPDELNFTMDGTWIGNSDSNTPFGEPFRVYNRFDGAFLDYCP
ncbi:MAG: hypothetical protein ACF8LL_08825 [Phycisphaerales bacterium]